ncbi:hypothetical protein LX36DRAFT_662502 [Colletotrichum falcatum]|nr:hypothetical protein LX36DRAFT_662502 [Colletotrichum falcatum]
MTRHTYTPIYTLVTSAVGSWPTHVLLVLEPLLSAPTTSHSLMVLAIIHVLPTSKPFLACSRSFTDLELPRGCIT